MAWIILSLGGIGMLGVFALITVVDVLETEAVLHGGENNEADEKTNHLSETEKMNGHDNLALADSGTDELENLQASSGDERRYSDDEFEDEELIRLQEETVLGDEMEQQRFLQEEQNRLIREEQERFVRDEQNRLFQEEQERLIHEEQERLIREEQDRLFQEEQDRILREEQDRMFQEQQEFFHGDTMMDDYGYEDDFDWDDPYTDVGTDVNIDMHYHGVVDDPLDTTYDSYDDHW